MARSIEHSPSEEGARVAACTNQVYALYACLCYHCNLCNVGFSMVLHSKKCGAVQRLVVLHVGLAEVLGSYEHHTCPTAACIVQCQ